MTAAVTAPWTHSALVPLPVAISMLAAALLAATQALRWRRVAEAIAVLAAAGATAVCVLLLLAAVHRGELVYWFGGWRPHHGVALGIDFAVDPLGAGLAAFSGVLTIAALVFSWHHFESVGHAFPALMLVLLAALTGFCLSGDLFDMFVFFELMTVVAIALTAYRSDERAPLQGALNFGICNAIGGVLVLFGIALLYGRTGALNLAEIAAALRARPPDDLVYVAFGLIASGFLIKAAIIPFHFWLPDAYASAPTPVCIVFAGVMSEMGLFGLARVYDTAFAAALAPEAGTIRLVLVIAGSVTALGGAGMCLLQDQIKRLLAFATISSMGLFLIGFGLLDVRGLAGAAIYVVADGLIKAGLFVCVGVLQHRRADAGSLRIKGLGRGLPLTGAVFALGALGLAAVPGSGSFAARTLIELGADAQPGYGWVPVVAAVTEAVTAAAVLAAGARAFLGWGPDLPSDTAGASGDDDPEDPAVRGEPPPLLLVGPAVVLVISGIALGAVPGLQRFAVAAATRFGDGTALDHGALADRLGALHAGAVPAYTASDLLIGAGLTLATIALALAVVVPRRMPARPAAVARRLSVAAHGLRDLHSGHPGDYVTWLMAGTAALCVTLVLALG